MFEIQGRYSKAIIFAKQENVEQECISQIYTMLNHPAFTEPVRIMPDCHTGKGSVIGFTMPLTEMVIPNVVGVDIGCGMLGIQIQKPKGMDLAALDKQIRDRIPFGFEVHYHTTGTYALEDGHKFYTEAQSSLDQLWIRLREKFGTSTPKPPRINHTWFQALCAKIGQDFQRALNGIGTLGGGNHFIEIGISSTNEDLLWVIVHSGSRQLGKNVCEYHQRLAAAMQKQSTEGNYQQQIEQIKKTTSPKDTQRKIQELRAQLGITSGISQKGLEPLMGKAMYDYLYDMAFAQCYATHNRAAIMQDVLSNIVPKPAVQNRLRPRLLATERVSRSILEQVETVHNYISPKDLIIRKGAVAAYREKVIIPFNMKDGTWICTGWAEKSWNFSAPHGAGRAMSRTKAKQILKQEDAEKAMNGIYTSAIPLDEAPEAYKNPEEIQQAIIPTVGLVEQIKPIMNMKAK
jgi:RNA-splicing ligase RtcB